MFAVVCSYSVSSICIIKSVFIPQSHKYVCVILYKEAVSQNVINAHL